MFASSSMRLLSRTSRAFPSAPLGARRALSALDLSFVPLDLSVDPLDETARSALAKSCYIRIEWKVSGKKTVSDAVKTMCAHDIGALAVVDDRGIICGIISERDIMHKVGLLGKDPKTTLISSVATMGANNLKSVTLDNAIDKCQNKVRDSRGRQGLGSIGASIRLTTHLFLLPHSPLSPQLIASNVRHLFVRENGAKHHETNKFVGMISVKDVVKCSIDKHNAVVNRLTGYVVNSEQMRSSS